MKMMHESFPMSAVQLPLAQTANADHAHLDSLDSLDGSNGHARR